MPVDLPEPPALPDDDPGWSEAAAGSEPPRLEDVAGEPPPPAAVRVAELVARVQGQAAELAAVAEGPRYDLATDAPLLGDFLPAAWAAMGRRASGEDKPAPLPWNGKKGIASKLGGGLWPGLYVLTGGTGSGKTQWALQAALHAALEGWPVLYCGLELDREGIAARLAAMLARRQWSDLYLGRRATEVAPTEKQRGRSCRELEEVMHATGDTLAKLPFRLDMGPPFGWSYDRLAAGVRGMAEAHPGKRPVVVLDFLQLVMSPEGREREDLRERIGRAAYAGRQAARDHGAAVLLLSATARGNYEALNFKARPTKAKPDRPPRVDVRTMGEKPKPIPFAGELVGLGKESGEIEYAADYVLSLAAEWSRRKDEPMIQAKEPRTGRWGLSPDLWMKWRPVHVATAKTRAGAGIGWNVLGFNGSWFGELAEADKAALQAWREPPGDDEEEAEGEAEAPPATAPPATAPPAAPPGRRGPR